MLYLYLDESGDLGFDFVEGKPSKFFVVTILAIHGTDQHRQLLKWLKTSMRRKSSKNSSYFEFKGSLTPLKVKGYFYQKISKLDFAIYSVILDKKKSFQRMWYDKERIYSFIADSVLKNVLIEKNISRIEFVIDKSKSKQNIKKFDSYILSQMKGRVHPKVPLTIKHVNSLESQGIQVVDLFSWGIFRKYEREDTEWYNYFKEKIKLEALLAI